MDFEWDEAKSSQNIEKHGVTFQEATTVFSDPLTITFDDPDHSLLEDRQLSIGLSALDRLLIVSHTDRGDSTRIITARIATPKERRDYETKT